MVERAVHRVSVRSIPPHNTACASLAHTRQVSKTLNEHISSFCQVTLESLAYAGTGDVLKVQQLLAMCGEHVETEEATAWKAQHHGPAVIGLALIAMAEPLGSQMAARSLEHMLQYRCGGVGGQLGWEAVWKVVYVVMRGTQMAARSLEHMLQYRRGGGRWQAGRGAVRQGCVCLLGAGRKAV